MGWVPIEKAFDQEDRERAIGERKSRFAKAHRNPKAGRLPRVKGKPFGHHIAPKKYRKLGFTKPGHYAWPYGFSYPIGDAKHTRLASQRFSMHRGRYPKFARETIARRINMAKKYFGIAEYRVPGKKSRKHGRKKVQFAVRRAA